MSLRQHLRRVLRPLRRRRHGAPSVRTRHLGPKDVAVIVLNWNKREVTLACLASLARAALDGATTWLVDNGSHDGSVDAVRARFPTVRVVALPENRGYAGGNNAGIRAAMEAGAGAVLLLNNDTEVAPDFLAPLLQVLNGDGQAAAVSSAVMRLDSPEVLQEAWCDVHYRYGLARHVGVNALPGEGFDRVRQVDAAIGCSLLVAADAFARVGLLDESYFAYHEEIDWCVRAREAGYVLYYQPYSRVYHHFSKSTDVSRPPRTRCGGRAESLPNPIPLTWNPVRTYLGARNAVRFIRGHAGPLRRLRFAASVAYNIPLELLAVVVDREEELHMGLLTYRGALARYCLEAVRGTADRARSAGDVLRAIGRVPYTLFHDLPRDVRRARAEGQTAQVEASLRGHWDGVRDHPLPLEQLGLRDRPEKGAGRMTPSEVTIVVLNWNGWHDTVDCLESLAAADLQGASILVVDNGSRDDSVTHIHERFPSQPILALSENQGYAGGNNAGIRSALEAGAGGVLLLNNDTRVAPDFLSPLLAVMRDSPSAGAVTSQILRLDRPELLDVGYLEVHFGERNVVQLQGVNRLPSEGYDYRKRVRVAPGCCLLFRAVALREVGLFDEAYFAYHEDVDWCLRAAACGWDVYYEPYSRVYHKGSRSTERFFRKPPRATWRPEAAQLPHAEPMPFNPVRTYLGMRNTVRLLRRHGKPIHRVAFGLDLARLLPLETTAVILGAESLYRLGRWSWTDVVHAYLDGGTVAHPGSIRTLRRLVALPLAVGWRFPRDLIRAARTGRLGEIAETLRGLRDGVLDRALPLARLGLR